MLPYEPASVSRHETVSEGETVLSTIILPNSILSSAMVEPHAAGAGQGAMSSHLSSAAAIVFHSNVYMQSACGRVRVLRVDSLTGRAKRASTPAGCALLGSWKKPAKLVEVLGGIQSVAHASNP